MGSATNVQKGYQQWYLDDGCLCGEAEMVASSLPAIEESLKRAHLQLTHKKHPGVLF
jgi:hypothetical protein